MHAPPLSLGMNKHLINFSLNKHEVWAVESERRVTVFWSKSFIYLFICSFKRKL